MRHLMLCLLAATCILSPRTSLAFRATVDSTMPTNRTQQFRDRYKVQRDSGEIRDILRKTFLATFGLKDEPGTENTPAHLYATALEKAFYDDTDTGKANRKLESGDRERVLIPILANRADDFALAVHIYMGWLEGIEPQEIGELLFLAGFYNGVNTMTHSLGVYRRTFKVVDTSMKPEDGFLKALQQLNKEFSTEPPRVPPNP